MIFFLTRLHFAYPSTFSICLELYRVPEGQQRVAGCYLNMMCQIKTLYLTYCSSHPSAVGILTDHRSALCNTAFHLVSRVQCVCVGVADELYFTYEPQGVTLLIHKIARRQIGVKAVRHI